jgi:spore coat protein U-like protein
MKLILALLAAFVATALAAPAEAGQATAVMQVRATVVESCSVTADTLDFALDTTPGARANGQAQVALSCNGPAAYEIALDAGQNGAREMVDPASGTRLPYEIYSDPARTQRWGNALGVDTVAGTAGEDGAAELTAYGATLASADTLVAGTYADAVVVTVNF